MKKRIVLGVLLITAVVVMAPQASSAGWDVSISFPLPGVVYYYPPPMMAPPPVYGAPFMAPMLYGGYWYRPVGGEWFISAQVGGPWYGIALQSVPAPVLRVPPYRDGGWGRDGRSVPPRSRHEDRGQQGGGRSHDRHDD
jgi:hypothetical protein